MKKSLSLIIFAALLPVGAFGAELTPGEALSRLERSGDIHRLRSGKDCGSYRLASTVGSLYVFQRDNGFVVLPDDDAMPPLLAYSDTGTFEIEGNPALAEWLDYYNREIEYVKKQGNAPQTARKQKRESREAITPLIKTEWNQEYPYNMLCPKVDGRETVTGCVATAMAQMLKFYNYPEHGKGTHSYLWRPGEEELSFDYEHTPFQWNLMTDIYDSKSTEEERYAVAQLMLACGISVDMHYEPGGSGAATTLMGESLIDIFDYSPSLWMPNRTFYGLEEWENMVYGELAEGRPVLYSGAGTAGGHQFICDGYSSDGFFHFNWGWGGLSNGYFLLTALNPDDLGVGGGAGGFNTSQIATLGVRPPKDGDKPVYIMYNTEAFETEVNSVREGEDFNTTGLYFNYSLSNMPDGSRLGLKFSSSDGSTVKYVEGPGVGGFHPDDGRRNVLVKFPELADGSYRITPALLVEGVWSDVRMPVGYPSVINAVVEDKVASIQNQKEASVVVADVQLPEKIYVAREFPMPFDVRNESTEEYYGSVTPYLVDKEGKNVSKSTFRPVDVAAGQTEKVTDYVALFEAEKDSSLPAGDYNLIFRDEQGKDISAPIPVKVEILTSSTEIKVMDFKLEDSETVSDPSAVRFGFDVKCESGVYFGALSLYVFSGDGGRAVYHRDSEKFYITVGETKALEVTADLSRLEDGDYMAAVYMGGESMTGSVWFHIDRKSTSIKYLERDDAEGLGESVRNSEYKQIIYDLNGLSVEGNRDTLRPGLYILRQGSDVRKIIIR